MSIEFLSANKQFPHEWIFICLITKRCQPLSLFPLVSVTIIARLLTFTSQSLSSHWCKSLIYKLFYECKSKYCNIISYLIKYVGLKNVTVSWYFKLSALKPLHQNFQTTILLSQVGEVNAACRLKTAARQIFVHFFDSLNAQYILKRVRVTSFSLTSSSFQLRPSIPSTEFASPESVLRIIAKKRSRSSRILLRKEPKIKDMYHIVSIIGNIETVWWKPTSRAKCPYKAHTCKDETRRQDDKICTTCPL